MQNTRVSIIQISLVLLWSVSVKISAQEVYPYSFIVAGHAYGSHDGTNIGLHPAFLANMDSGFDSLAAFLVFTGDIVRKSTVESWQQVEDELGKYTLPYYYVMGNHDDDDIGYQVFNDKYGGAYYSFNFGHELFIVLNSTEEQRSISTRQVNFLQEKLNTFGDTVRNVFIFFHEILWNSHEKYSGVNSNSRSRYNNIVKYSNYWEDVHPVLLGKPGINFHVITGDVGGNEDAIAAFYDQWDNITLISSGMGEVPDENYLRVRVQENDSIEFILQPLNPELKLPDIKYFSVPPAADTITGPDLVTPASSGIEYTAPEVFNAESYLWELPAGLSGASDSGSIMADISPDFTEGTISVRALKTGFGSGPVTSKVIRADNTAISNFKAENNSFQVEIKEDHNFLTIGLNHIDSESILVRLIDIHGKILMQERISIMDKSSQLQIDRGNLPRGIVLLTISTDNRQFTKKIAIR